MSEPTATPERAPTDYTRIVLVALVVGMGGAIFSLVKTIRDSPCYQHKDGEAPLVEVAKSSAKLATVPYDQGDEPKEKFHVIPDSGTPEPVASNGKPRRRIGQGPADPVA